VRNDFAETSRLFGVSRAELDHVRTGPWLELLMRILIMDYINILLTKNAFPTAYNLKDAFEVAATHCNTLQHQHAATRCNKCISTNCIQPQECL